MNNIHGLYTKDSIRTFTGKYVNVFAPSKDTIDIEDIAHALSNQCRFGGHTRDFYSVAQHSCFCADFFQDKKQKLEALLHDSAEAYLVDLPSPIKRRIEQYSIIENCLLETIFSAFGLDFLPMSERIKKIDQHMLQIEWMSLMTNDLTNLFTLWSPQKAKQEFLNRFYENF